MNPHNITFHNNISSNLYHCKSSDKRNVSLLVRLHGVKTGTVRNYGEALELLGQLGDGEVLWLGAQAVQVAEVPVHGVVLHDGDPGQGGGAQDELRTRRRLRVVGAVHARVSAGRLAVV